MGIGKRLQSGVAAVIAMVGIIMATPANPAFAVGAVGAPGRHPVATSEVRRVYLGTQPSLSTCQALGQAWLDRIVAYDGYVCEPVAGGYALYMLIFVP
jgi:hypothetical protein